MTDTGEDFHKSLKVFKLETVPTTQNRYPGIIFALASHIHTFSLLKYVKLILNPLNENNKPLDIPTLALS